MITNEEFLKYVDDYKKFIGQANIDMNDSKNLALFFQYLQTRNILEVRLNIAEQNVVLTELIKLIKSK
ncbi:MAG: hypothetical protein P0Y62_18985 [Candidatus Chryseobacterium colombiense]|nr:hypothetical protein [Chryseobacterium sp.]WEK69879.1 MAG: hypothetical protein P0Y62_18985 [Chryseobacterium sp.]